MESRIVSDLENFGALRTQLIDLAQDTGPRTLPYLDLTRSTSHLSAPVVFEVQGKARAFIFDGRGNDSEAPVTHWIRRVALRGDADWVGVFSPGRLDVYRAALDGQKAPRPEPLPQGPFLFPSLIHVGASEAPSVRAALLKLLRKSVEEVQRLNVRAEDALSIVGRALFWRFLLDRELLADVDPSTISAGATRLESCLDNKTRALRTFEWLERTFNGSLLPFSSPHSAEQMKPEVFERVVGNIAHGATADGQLSLKLPIAWHDVNFAHIPVGLLSEVYEAFAHTQYEKKARAESVFYTPRHIAEFVVDEALMALAEVEEPRVLDPACGAGVFLVAAYRALVAREWQRQNEKPTRKTVRRILNRQLVGFDINDNALRLSELALYLTAIELDPEPQPRPLDLLRFKALRNNALFLKPGGPGEGSLGPVEPRFRGRFDAVIGNPPWTASEGVATKRVWVENTKETVAQLLGDARASTFDFPDTNPDLPFVYRATEWLRKSGVIALITHARWLFGQSDPALAARRDLFQSVHVTGVLNGSALRKSHVWPSIESPFCLLFAINERPPDDSTFQFVSPQLEASPDRMQRHLRIDWQDSGEIPVVEVLHRPWLLKTRFRGTSIDEAILDDIQQRGIKLGSYLESLGTALRNGYQIGGAKQKQHSARHMNGMRDLHGVEPVFFLDKVRLRTFSRATLLRPRDPGIFQGPLLLVHESMTIDAMAPRAVVSIKDVAYDERFSGASFVNVPNGAQLALYLQLFMQSSVFTHALLFLDGQYGVEREVVHKETLDRVPIVSWDDLPPSLRKRSHSLSERLKFGMSKELSVKIDGFAADVFRLSDVQREAIADTIATALPTNIAKANATRHTTPSERQTFATVCENELRDLLSPFVSVSVCENSDSPWQLIRIDTDNHRRRKEALIPDARAFLAAANEGAASLVTIRGSEHTTVVGILDQFRYWTRTRARLLASDLVSGEIDG